jgi:hypothetical protein
MMTGTMPVSMLEGGGLTVAYLACADLLLVGRGRGGSMA